VWGGGGGFLKVDTEIHVAGNSVISTHLVILTCSSAMHVSWVLEQLGSTPQWPYVGALLKLKGNLSNKVQKLVGLCQGFA
jgi:hypothetical protein